MCQAQVKLELSIKYKLMYSQSSLVARVVGGGCVGWWWVLDFMRLMLISTQVEVVDEVGVELGNMTSRKEQQEKFFKEHFKKHYMDIYKKYFKKFLKEHFNSRTLKSFSRALLNIRCATSLQYFSIGGAIQVQSFTHRNTDTCYKESFQQGTKILSS